MTPTETTPVINLDEAKKAIEQEKATRAAKFKEELGALCEKYQCDLQVGGILIIPK